MTNTWLARYRGCLSSGTMIFALITGIGAISTPLTASARTRRTHQFRSCGDPQFVKCLRRSQYAEPRARATVIRGKLNDVLFLDLDGFKPGLQFDLFTVQRTSLLDAQLPIQISKVALAWRGTSRTSRSASESTRVTFGSRPFCSIRFWFRSGCGTQTYQHLPPGILVQQSTRCGSLWLPSQRSDQVHSLQWRAQGRSAGHDQRPRSAHQLGPLCTDPDSSQPSGCNP